MWRQRTVSKVISKGKRTKGRGKIGVAVVRVFAANMKLSILFIRQDNIHQLELIIIHKQSDERKASFVNNTE
jgi:hypothetical protein